MVTALVIFVVTYLLIASEKVNKTLVAVFAACLLVGLKIITQEKAFSYIDLNVIVLLVSMMMIVKIVEKTGMFEFLAVKFAKKVKGNPKQILVILFLMTAFFSSLLPNITTVLLIAPISILIANELRISPLPFLVSEIFAANLGGTATLIGDPPNIMIGSAANFTFMDFIYNLAPVILLQLLVFSVLFLIIFRKILVVTNANRARIQDFNEKTLIKDPVLLKRSMAILGMVLIGFIFQGALGIEATTVSLIGAIVLIFISKTDTEEIFEKADWQTIFFFGGLFVLVGSLVETGFIEILSRKMLALSHGNVKTTAEIIVWFSGIFSAVVDNIPFVATMIPVFKNLSGSLGAATIKPLWWALSLGACLGGNGTLIGSSSNIIIASFANRSGHRISFFSYLKYGIPLTLLSLLISYGYLFVRYF